MARKQQGIPPMTPERQAELAETERILKQLHCIPDRESVLDMDPDQDFGFDTTTRYSKSVSKLQLK